MIKNFEEKCRNFFNIGRILKICRQNRGNFIWSLLSKYLWHWLKDLLSAVTKATVIYVLRPSLCLLFVAHRKNPLINKQILFFYHKSLLYIWWKHFGIITYKFIWFILNSNQTWYVDFTKEPIRFFTRYSRHPNRNDWFVWSNGQSVG